MVPAFLDTLQNDSRFTSGGFYSQDPLVVERGDTVGVVMLHRGTPATHDAMEAFVYERMMDPAAPGASLPRIVRARFARFVARRRARRLAREYEQVGGCASLNRHPGEQARALEQRLNDRFGALTGARFKTFTASRYGAAASEAAGAVAKAGVDKVVLLPLYPQYARATTGSSLAHWRALDAAADTVRPTTFVYEYAAHPKFVQALAERIDEGLQRFPREVRPRVRLLFTAPTIPQRDLAQHADPYCCLVHTTVEHVVAQRVAADPGRAYHVAFQEHDGFGKGLTPEIPDALDRLADEGHDAVLVVPVTFVSDHVGVAYALDIALREEATEHGIEHYEVTSALNCHPLFIEALAECAAAQLAPTDLARGDGADALPASLPELPVFASSERAVRCQTCTYAAEAHDWSREPAVHVPVPVAVEKSAPRERAA